VRVKSGDSIPKGKNSCNNYKLNLLDYSGELITVFMSDCRSKYGCSTREYKDIG